jgi:hypothetical protein
MSAVKIGSSYEQQQKIGTLNIRGGHAFFIDATPISAE